LSNIEEAAFNKLQQIKVDNEKNNIFIFDCVKCNYFIMLHMPTCIHCKEINAYFDSSLQVSKVIEEKVTKLLLEIYTVINGGMDFIN
jgi:hypothetical protein